MKDSRDPGAVYRERAAHFAAERDRLAGQARRVSLARIITFVGALALLLRAESVPAGAAPVAFAGGAALLVAFFGLIIYHGRMKRASTRLDLRVSINEEARRRLARDWDGLPNADVPGPGPTHPYAEDLDIFGRASLFQLLGTVATAPGRATLREWLLAPAPPAEVRERQVAAAELAPMLDLRESFAVRGRLGGRAQPEEVERFLRWAEGEPWLPSRPLLVWATRLLPLATAALAVADLAGAIAFPAWALTIAAGLLLTWATAARVHGTFGRAFVREGAFRRYAGLLRLLSEAPLDAPRLRALQADLRVDGVAAHRWMARLGRIGALADTRFSSVHFVIHALTLWDFHVLLALEHWQRATGRRARRWIEALGEADALAALAALRHAHPDWAFPELVEDGAPSIEATSLGHPLLPPGPRVDNDVVVGPPGTFLLVTGSNMSGKSTLLRAIGVNVVLGQAGGPVCASAMRIPPVTLHTSMRVADSLEQGVSYFMAEVQRLKQVVDAARGAAAAGERRLLYLLDEILHGTNSAERQVAAQRVIAFLVARGAIGAVSTHDLAMADAEALAAAAHAVHFTETVHPDGGRPAMSFDYRLRPGVATSTNALRLMEIVGLALEPEPAP